MPEKLRRGFKAEAERTAASVRANLGLSAVDRLDCLQLADALGIPVISLKELRKFGAASESITRLLRPQSGFSALTVGDGDERVAVNCFDETVAERVERGAEGPYLVAA